MTAEELASAWLPLPDVAERIGAEVGEVRRMLQEGRLVALRVGERRILSVPEDVLVPDGAGWQVAPALAGTLSVLADAGFSDEQALTWLLTVDESLASLGPDRPRTAMAALAAGHKTEIRRRAQAEAL